MEAILHLDIPAILTAIFETAGIGYIVIFAIIFAESGLLVGIFFPGDSLLFTAGLLASRGIINIWILIAITFVAAITGDSVGYTFGYKVGPMLFRRENSRIFKKENLLRAESFYERHGAKAVAGPAAAEAERSTEVFNAQVLVYSNVKGFYAGATVKTGAIAPIVDATQQFYDTHYGIPEILFSDWVKPQPESQPLMNGMQKLTQ